MKTIMGGSAVAVVSPSVFVGCLPEQNPDNFAIFPEQDIEGNSWRKVYGGKTYIRRALAGHASPLGCGVYHHAGYGGKGFGALLCNESLFGDDWTEFLRRYQVMRTVIEGGEAVKEEVLQEKDICGLLNTLYRASYYLRYHGISEELIQGAVRDRTL